MTSTVRSSYWIHKRIPLISYSCTPSRAILV
jgi:hypothetical protein